MRCSGLAAVLLLSLVGCEFVNKDPVCTDLAAISVTVRVSDDAGNPVDDATVSFESDSGQSGSCELWSSGEYACGYEVQGEITVTVEHTGYASVTETVTVDADECHVIGEVLDITLEGIPCTDEEVVSIEVTVADELAAEIPEAEVLYGPANEDVEPVLCSPVGSTVWHCGYEAAGIFDVIAQAPGYETFQTVVTVDSDECHVITESVTATLYPVQ